MVGKVRKNPLGQMTWGLLRVSPKLNKNKLVLSNYNVGLVQGLVEKTLDRFKKELGGSIDLWLQMIGCFCPDKNCGVILFYL